MSITYSASESLDIKYDSMLCPVSHDVIPLMVNILIRFPTVRVLTNVSVWEYLSSEQLDFCVWQGLLLQHLSN
jgi:hypothetical protein